MDITYEGWNDEERCPETKTVPLDKFDPLEISANWEEGDDIAQRVAAPLIAALKKTAAQLQAAQQREAALIQMLQKSCWHANEGENYLTCDWCEAWPVVDGLPQDVLNNLHAATCPLAKAALSQAPTEGSSDV